MTTTSTRALAPECESESRLKTLSQQRLDLSIRLTVRSPHFFSSVQRNTQRAASLPHGATASRRHSRRRRQATGPERRDDSFQRHRDGADAATAPLGDSGSYQRSNLGRRSATRSTVASSAVSRRRDVVAVSPPTALRVGRTRLAPRRRLVVAAAAGSAKTRW